MNPEEWPQRLLVVDVEGNGAQPPDLVEFAAIPLIDGCPDPSGTYTVLVRPPVPITPMAARIHGITNQAAAHAPAWPQVCEAVQALLDGAWIAAHSARVEYDVLTRHLPDWQPAGVLDTLRISRHLYGQTTRHNLDALIAHTGLDLSAIPGQRHRAAYDAHATALLLAHLAEQFDTFASLAAVAVPPSMPGLPTTTENAHDTSEGTLW